MPDDSPAAIWQRDRTTAAVSYPLAYRDNTWHLLDWNAVNALACRERVGTRFFVVYPPWADAPSPAASTYYWRLAEFEVVWGRHVTGEFVARFRELSSERLDGQRVADFKQFAGLA